LNYSHHFALNHEKSTKTNEAKNKYENKQKMVSKTTRTGSEAEKKIAKSHSINPIVFP
jgi:hypothetical protein